MLTLEELARVALFAQLPPRELQHLARQAADIHLGPGEYAVNEGDARALFAVLEGEIEVTKRFDGVERRIGGRLPGTIFGEVPIALGGLFLGGYRAVAASRVARIEAQQYYAIAAASPAFAAAVGALAAERIGGLQGLAAKAPDTQATVFGHKWDGACSGLRRFLARNQVHFDWFSPDDPELPERWRGAAAMAASGVQLQLADGSTLHNPPPREVAERLGLQTRPRRADYDTVIIGGGPAGLAAAVYGASEGLRTLVIEREAPGGQAGTSSRIENYLGFPNGVSGDELASRALQQARRLGAEILVTREVRRIDPLTRDIHLDGDDRIATRSLIVATGVSWRRLALDGFDRFIGKGISYGASRSEAGNTQGVDIHLIGAGNSAGQAALFFSNHARSVTLLVRGPSLQKGMSQYLVEQLRSKPNIVVELNAQVLSAHGDGHLSEIVVGNADGSARRCACGGLFVFIGADAETDWLPAEIARDARGYLLTGVDVQKAGAWKQARDPYLLETSVPGVLACGDVRFSPVKRVAAAVGEGSMAIAFTHQYLQRDGARPAA